MIPVAQIDGSDRRLRAFTLIEMMIVLVIISIMTAVIIPEMRGTYRDAQLKAVSRDLINVFDVAASRAVSFNQVHRVLLDFKGGKFMVERLVKGEGRDAVYETLKDVPGSEGVWDKRLTLEFRGRDEDSMEASSAPDPASPSEPAEAEGGNFQPEDAIAFYPDGTADARNLLLRDSEGFRIGLRINPATARIHLIELNPK